MTPIYLTALNEFSTQLEELGFEKTGLDSEAQGAWIGKVYFTYCKGGVNIHDSALIKINTSSAFPYEKPHVFPVAPQIKHARHQSPSDYSICLWPQDRGWYPGFTAWQFLNRVSLWYSKHYSNSWSSEDRPPDRHLYYNTYEGEPRTLVVIDDDWKEGLSAHAGTLAIDDCLASWRVLASFADRKKPYKSSFQVMSKKTRVGVWFSLNEEPPVLDNMYQLLKVIDKDLGKSDGWALKILERVIGSRVRSAILECVIALGYPAEGETIWLCLKVKIGAASSIRKGKWKLVEIQKEMKLISCETASVSKPDLIRRTSPTANILYGHDVKIFGIGSIGSSIALLLAKAGISKITVIDSDSLRPTNSIRHECGFSLAGMPKGKAIKEHIETYNPYCDVEVHDSTWDLGKLKNIIADGSVVVDATANQNFSLLINDLCLKVQVPLISVASHRNAAIGRIRLVRPNSDDACLVCYDGENGISISNPEYPIIPKGDEVEFVESGCGDPTVQATSIDVEAISNQATKTIIQYLKRSDGENNFCFVVNDLIEGAAKEFGVVGIHWFFWKRIVNCEACSPIKNRANDGKIYESAWIENTAKENILSESKFRNPLETGGILLGKRVGSSLFIRHAVGPGPIARHGASSFERDGKYSQDELDRIFNLSRGEVDYIGEWHSHPANVSFSELDLRSLRLLSRDPEYSCKNPIMIISSKVSDSGWRLNVFQWDGVGLKEMNCEEY